MRPTKAEPARRRSVRNGGRQRHARGFTLVEMVVAITLLAVISLAAVPLLRLPLQAYADTARRTDAVQTLDAVQVRLRQDLSRALPGSVRVRQVGGRALLEYLEVRAVGRHRIAGSGAGPTCPAACAAPGQNDALEASCVERCFTSLGPLDGAAPAPGSDWVVVNPQGAGIPGGDPWLGGVATVPGGIKSRLMAAAPVSDGWQLSIAPHRFPALAASRRFWLVSQPVTWDCDPGTGRLTRRWGYPIAAAQPLAFAGGTSSPMADGISACRFEPVASGSEGRGTVTAWLRVTRSVASIGSVESAELNSSLPVGMP